MIEKRYWGEFNRKFPRNSPEIADYIERHLTGKVLDIGCNAGADVNYFHNRGFTVEGCDIDRETLDAGVQKFQVPLFEHNFIEETLKHKYDSAYCLEVIEHIDDYRTFIKNIALCVKGNIVFSTPNIFGLANWVMMLLRKETFGINAEDESHIRFFSPNSLCNALKTLGFEIVDFRTFSSWGGLPQGWGGTLVIVVRGRRENEPQKNNLNKGVINNSKRGLNEKG